LSSSQYPRTAVEYLPAFTRTSTAGVKIISLTEGKISTLSAIHRTARNIIEKHIEKGTSFTEIPLFVQLSADLLKKVYLCTFRNEARVIMLTKTANIENT
jgi:hypothetical protein